MTISQFKQIKLLFVDDDVFQQKVFKRLIDKESLPYDYLIASSVNEAREHLASHDRVSRPGQTRRRRNGRRGG